MTNYTWSHAIEDYRPIGTGKPGAFPVPQLVNNFRLERASSEIDMRHRWALMWNYDLPFGDNLSGAAGMLARGWQINGVLLLHSGFPFSVLNASPRANTGGADRPNRVCDGMLDDDQRTLQR